MPTALPPFWVIGRSALTSPPLKLRNIQIGLPRAVQLEEGLKQAMTKIMQILPLQTTIGTGKDKQIEVLFSGPQRKLVQITLRENAVLAAHKAAVPITIQCIAGSGTLTVGTADKVMLQPGVLVTIEPNMIHEITAQPAVSILLTQFIDK